MLASRSSVGFKPDFSPLDIWKEHFWTLLNGESSAVTDEEEPTPTIYRDDVIVPPVDQV